MILIALVIKASQEPELKGYYSSFLLHPFENQIFTLNQNDQGYTSIKSILDLKSNNGKYIFTKDNDLIAILELDQGVILNKLDQEDIDILVNNWSSILAIFSEIKNIKSYFFSDKNYGDIMQIFIDINQYQNKIPEKTKQENINNSSYQEQHYQWLSGIYNQSKFIPDAKYYLIIKQKNQRNNINPIFRKIRDFIVKKNDKYFSEIQQNLEEDIYLLEEKIKTVKSFFSSYDLHLSLLEKKSLEDFYQNWLAKNYFKDEKIKLNPLENYYFIDKSKYLKHAAEAKYRISKTYRLISSPESGDLNFWINDLIKRANCRSFISIQLISRNAQKDRLNFEQKSLNTRQMVSLNKQSAQMIIKESELASEKLLNKGLSFDLALFITVLTNSEEELQAIDNQIQYPIKSAKFSGLERQQVKNYLSSLPFAFNELKDQEKIFTTIDFASACFSFISEQIGTKTGLLIGFNKDNAKPIFLDDYDRSECNNRNINFIGDSGSGKTVLAKLSILRSYIVSKKYFYIIDSTEDGWKFFINYLGGRIIEIDKINLKDNESLFSPFSYSENDGYEFNQHLEDLVSFLKFLKNSDQDLSATEKNFLYISLKELYNKVSRPRLSDLYSIWQSNYSSEIKKEWLDIIAPYCYISNGIYASLADGRQESIQDRLVLFTFSKICSDENYIKTSIFLLVNFISKKIIFEKQNNTNLVIDEAWKLLSSNKSTYAKDLITHLARAGRGLDLGLWTISQKPCDLPAEIHSNSSCSFIFQLKENKDRYDISRFANLKDKETEAINSGILNNSGICFMKTTKSSGFVDIKLDPYESMICNSTRAISNLRNKYFNEFKQKYNRQEAALATIFKLLSKSEVLQNV